MSDDDIDTVNKVCYQMTELSKVHLLDISTSDKVKKVNGDSITGAPNAAVLQNIYSADIIS